MTSCSGSDVYKFYVVVFVNEEGARGVPSTRGLYKDTDVSIMCISKFKINSVASTFHYFITQLTPIYF